MFDWALKASSLPSFRVFVCEVCTCVHIRQFLFSSSLPLVPCLHVFYVPSVHVFCVPCVHVFCVPRVHVFCTVCTAFMHACHCVRA